MGVLDALRWALFPDMPDLGTGDLEGRESVEDVIAQAVSDRQQAFTVADSLKLPSVRRGVDLITSVGASFDPQAYRDGLALTSTPRVLLRPDPYRSRQEFLSQTLEALVTDGNAYWRLGDRNENTGQVPWAVVLPNDEVHVEWDSRRFQPRYRWRDQDLIGGVGILHLAMRRPAGQLKGTGPLQSSLKYLATIDAAEAYAAVYFGSGGVPMTVLKSDRKLTKEEADKLKAQWAASRQSSTLTGEPAITSNGVEADFPGQDPQDAQMQQARDYGNTVVARVLGVPAPLLHVQVQGASLTYQNVGSVVSSFVKSTVGPLYLTIIESALADLMPRNYNVRFSLAELQRADVADRFDVYKTATEIGALSPDEVRLAEGWGEAPHDVTPVEPVTEALPAVSPPGVPAL